MPPAPHQGDPPGSPKRSDEELACLAQNASGAAASSAFGELVQRHEGSLFGFLFVRVGNRATAEELAQEAFVRAWRKLHLYDSKQRFGTWLYTIAKNLAVSRARVQRPATVPDEVLVHMADDTDPTLQVAHSEEVAGLWALAKEVLNEESCSALWLRYHDGLSNDEIASILDRRSVTVRVILFRAREALTRALGEEKSPQAAGTHSALRTGT